jgi:hypothetical protein
MVFGLRRVDVPIGSLLPPRLPSGQLANQGARNAEHARNSRGDSEIYQRANEGNAESYETRE